MIRPEFIKQLKHVRVYQIVVDEAHCLLDWGYSFRGAYLELGSAIKAIDPQCVSAFTATASPADEVEIQELLQIRPEEPYFLEARSGQPQRKASPRKRVFEKI